MERTKEVEKLFLERLSEYLLSLPFDLKILQEAVSDSNFDAKTREMVAGAIIHTILPQEGNDLMRFVDDVFLVRATLARIGNDDKSEGSAGFRERFADVYARLAEDEKLFAQVLGDLWPWLQGKLDGFTRLVLKGKTPKQYTTDEDSASLLYDENEVFQTNYNVSEEQVRNKIRRLDHVLDVLQKRRADDMKKKS